jgi:type IX secretion system PorP/SprF family membrane protein
MTFKYILYYAFASLILLNALQVHAQDPQFSQVYSAPLYLNPAFAGNLEYNCRKLPISKFKSTINYRNQWTGRFNTTAATVEFREKKERLGFAGIWVQDRIGEVALSNTTIGAIGSYKLPIVNDWQVHFGLQANMNYRTVNFNNFIFPDEFSLRGRTEVTQDPIVRAGEARMFYDFATGALLFNDKFYLGMAAHHLNQPNQTLTNEVDKLPMKVSLHTGYRYPFKRTRGFAKRGADKSVTPTLHYKYQGAFQQMDLGTYFNYDPLVLGLWYRGVFFDGAPEPGRRQQDAIVALLGLHSATDYGVFRFGFSYDISASRVRGAFGRTFELSLSYQPIDEKCRKKVVYRRIPCPGL